MHNFSSVFFSKRIRRWKRIHKSNESRLQKAALYRLLNFLGIFLSLSIGYVWKEFNTISYFFFVLFILLFSGSVRYFQNFSNYQERIESILSLLKRESLRNQRKVSELFREIPEVPEALQTNHYYKDLDLFGKFGFYNYLDTTVTKKGKEDLLNHLLMLSAPDSEKIQKRQEALKEFLNKPILTWKLYYLLQEISPDNGYSKLIFRHSESIPESFSKSFLYKISTFIPFLTYGLAIFLILSDLPPIWSSLLFLHIFFYAFRFKERKKFLKRKETYYKTLLSFQKISQTFEKVPFQSKLNQTLNTGKDENTNTFPILKSIENRLSLSSVPLIDFLLNFFIFWDYTLLRKINRLEANYKDILRSGIEKIEYLDSMFPFLIFALHNPDMEFPEISEDQKSLEAKSFGHPMILPEHRVYNPLEKIQEKELVLITGSNMSGKTTFLRTIGINVLLALCGSKVPATEMKLPPLKILSSIKNEDSLTDGISFFYSEVRKLAYILDTLNAENQTCLVLIDEVLKGTNTRERLIASSAILKKLSASRSFSYVTTHDLELAKENKTYKLRHFTEMVVEEKMSFDYRIREGVITSGNALKILEIECPGLFTFN